MSLASILTLVRCKTQSGTQDNAVPFTWITHLKCRTLSVSTRMNHSVLTISGSHTSGNSYINVVLCVLLEIKGQGEKCTSVR